MSHLTLLGCAAPAACPDSTTPLSGASGGRQEVAVCAFSKETRFSYLGTVESAKSEEV